VLRLALPVLAAVVVAPATAAACTIPKHGVTVPFHDRSAVVYTHKHNYYACLRRSKRSVLLLRTRPAGASDANLSAYPLAHAGNKLAFVVVDGTNQYERNADIALADLARGQLDVVAPNAAFWGSYPEGVGELAVDRTGAVAWVWTRRRADGNNGSVVKQALYGTARRLKPVYPPVPGPLVSDFAPSPITDVRVANRVVTWTRDGAQQSARLA
jgi:hypothetical protein